MRTISAVMCLALAVVGCGGSDKKDGPTPGCGDSAIVAPETCDDGNTDAGDGRTAACTTEPVCEDGTCLATCGDGLVFPGEACDDGIKAKYEECDNGNNVDGDGCTADCLAERPT